MVFGRNQEGENQGIQRDERRGEIGKRKNQERERREELQSFYEGREYGQQ